VPDKRLVVTQVHEYPRIFKEWGIKVTLIKGEDGHVYFPVKQVCEGLGIDSDRQLKRLSALPDYKGALVDIRIQTAGGIQPVACIRRREAAWWLITIDDAHCKPEVRGHLHEIKQRLMDAADAILFGDIQRTNENERGILALSSRQEFSFACLDCGTLHHIVIINGEPTVTIEREAKG
jgi:hypothetical protein